MRPGGFVPPSPSPSPEPASTRENDPFNPDVTMWPEAPSWLFPTVMVALALAALVVITLLVMWRKSVVYEKREREAKGPTEWIDLSKLDKKGRWEDDGPTLDDSDSGNTDSDNTEK